jgi:hypothetical protein
VLEFDPRNVKHIVLNIDDILATSLLILFAALVNDISRAHTLFRATVVTV